MIAPDNAIPVESLNRCREEFIEILSHVLRNQVAAMGGYADLVATSGELNADQTLFLERVQAGTDRLNRMLPALIDLMWIEAGIPLRQQSVALDQVAAEVVADLEILAASRNIQIKLAVAEPLPDIRGDAARLKQALAEIVRNACVYSPLESSVSVEIWGDQKAVYCAIADQGIGINALDQDLIFDRLYRSADQRVREIQGSGLGLTLANRIVRAHHGELKVVSQLDQGSIFTLAIPITAP